MTGGARLLRAALMALAAGFAVTAMPALAAPSGNAALNDVARCVVSKDREAVARVSRKLPLSDEMVTIAPESLGAAASCVAAGKLEGPAVLVRGAIAQAFYFADFREAGLQPRTAVRNLVDLGWPESGATDAGAMLLSFGDCLARNDTQKVDNLMRAPYGSALSKKMIDLLKPYYAGCYPKGAEISANRDELHAAIAQGAYHAGVRYWGGLLSVADMSNKR